LRAADESLAKVSTRLGRILTRRHASEICRSDAASAVRAFALALKQRLGAFGSTSTTTTSTTLPADGTTSTTATLPDGSDAPTTTTTSSTTTTLPPGLSCFGDFAIYPIDAAVVTFSLWCNDAMTQFAIVVPGGRAITGHVAPEGFACEQPTIGYLVCAGPLPKDIWVQGRLRLAPAPASGMGGQVFAWWGTTAIGPFELTGPP
jgi:hypothetical protein